MLRNQLTTAAALSQTSLEQLLIQIRNAVDNSLNYVRETSAEIIDESSFQSLFCPDGKTKEGNSVFFFGDGAAKCKTAMSQNENAIFIENIFPSAKNMIALSENAFTNNQFEDVAYFEPFYLKDFVAGKKKAISP